MSGGSLENLYFRVCSASDIIAKYAEKIGDESRRELCMEFSQFIVEIATSLHAIERVMDGDYAPGDADEAIKAVLFRNSEMEGK